MMVGEAGDLREVSDAKNLIVVRQLLQTPGDAFRGAAADTGIDFVENEGTLRFA